MTNAAARRPSVGTHIIVGFGVCIVALGAVMASATVASFQRERERALSTLRVAAEKASAGGHIDVIELDPGRTRIVASSPQSGTAVGPISRRSWMRKPLGTQFTHVDSRGVARLYQEVEVPGVGSHVLASMPASLAVADARAEMRWNLSLYGLVVIMVTSLGLVLQRRIAGPVQDLTAVIARASAKDTPVDAVPSGPAEVAELAEVFNTTMRQRRDLEASLAAALSDAERTSRLKSEFLTNISHEVRTPMNGVLGMLSLLDDPELQPDQVRDCVQTIGDSARSLMELLNEMLDFEKLEAGTIQTENVPFDLRSTVRAAVRPWIDGARSKDVVMTTTVACDVPELVVGDELRVRQMLGSLVHNAVKFTDAGRIRVSVALATGSGIRFEVADSGIGISEDTLCHLFEPFVQADGTTTRRHGGIGLGLATCRQLADYLGGRIGVDSAAGVGSLFWFELPLAAAEVHTTVLSASPEAETRARVLVVDDNPVNRKVATQMLRRLGYETSEACDGREALDAMLTAEFDAVLMDVQMPVMDGLEASAQIRLRGWTVPIVAVTASGLDEDRRRCREAGMDDYVVKPISGDALRDALGRVRGSSLSAAG